MSELQTSKPVAGADPKAKYPFWQKAKMTVIHLLHQGVSPEELSLSLALGCTVGVFPLWGLTTILCLIVAIVLRLNLVAIQLGNWLMAPFHIGLILPFMRLGELIAVSNPIPLSVEKFTALARESPFSAVTMFGDGLVHALEGWVYSMPLATSVIFFALLPLARQWHKRVWMHRHKGQAGETSAGTQPGV